MKLSELLISEYADPLGDVAPDQQAKAEARQSLARILRAATDGKAIELSAQGVEDLVEVEDGSPASGIITILIEGLIDSIDEELERQGIEIDLAQDDPGDVDESAPRAELVDAQSAPNHD